MRLTVIMGLLLLAGCKQIDTNRLDFQASVSYNHKDVDVTVYIKGAGKGAELDNGRRTIN